MNESRQENEAAVTAFMARVAALPNAAPLREPMPLWWKAQLLRRWDVQHRVHEPLDLIERVEITAGLTAAAGMMLWVAPTVFRLLAGPFRLLLS